MSEKTGGEIEQCTPWFLNHLQTWTGAQVPYYWTVAFLIQKNGEISWDLNKHLEWYRLAKKCESAVSENNWTQRPASRFPSRTVVWWRYIEGIYSVCITTHGYHSMKTNVGARSREKLGPESLQTGKIMYPCMISLPYQTVKFNASWNVASPT